MNLNPFVILDNDSIYDAHNTSGELELYDPETQSGNITSEYLKDKAILLQKLIDINVNDKGVYEPTNQEYFKDYESGIVLSPGNVVGNDYPLNIQKQYIFGDSDDNTFSGVDRDDRLYGGDGIDTISGMDGDDYIEGNHGNDTIHGDDDNDEIHGGQGADHLYGDAGRSLSVRDQLFLI